MIIRKTELKKLAKPVSCGCDCKFDGRKCNPNQKWNNDKCRYEGKNLKEHHVYEKDYT